jgi:FkbM family methyltransferase
MTSVIEDNSQNGEFFELLRLLAKHAAPSKRIVDAGANSKVLSNSYDLLRLFGWYGLLIEANPVLSTKIHTDFEGLNYTLVSCALSDFEGTGELTLGITDGISALTPELTAQWGPVAGSVSVQVRRLHSVLDENEIPKNFAVLSLDLEGHEVKVLNDLHTNSKYRPQWIILEGSHDLQVTDPRQIGISEAVISDYDLVARNRVNLFFERK